MAFETRAPPNNVGSDRFILGEYCLGSTLTTQYFVLNTQYFVLNTLYSILCTQYSITYLALSKYKYP